MTIVLINRNAAAVWAVADSIEAAADELRQIAGEEISLEQIGQDEMEGRLGGNYYDAYRAPVDMDTADEGVAEVVARGHFLDHYEAVGEDEILRRRLEVALEGVSYEELKVEHGTCTVAFHDAPDADEGWCVEIRASKGCITALFDRDGGDHETVEVDFNGDEERQRVAFDGFLRNPASTAADMWESVVRVREAA